MKMYSIVFALQACTHSVPVYILECCSMHFSKTFPKYQPEIAQEDSASLFNGIILVGAITVSLSASVSCSEPPSPLFFSNKPSIYREERRAFLVDSLTLDVPPLLGYLDLAVQVLSICSKPLVSSLSVGERDSKSERLQLQAFTFIKFCMSHVNRVRSFYLLKSWPKVMMFSQHLILHPSLGTSQL